MIVTRPASSSDLQAMANVINPIIRAGGTTAFETELGAEDIRALTLDHPTLVCAFVVLDSDGVVAGFQYLKRIMPEMIGDIASFTRRQPKVSGAGRALMTATLKAAQAAGLPGIQAKIRADNALGLGYYSAMGFRDWRVEKALPLSDGTPVDRVIKYLDLSQT